VEFSKIPLFENKISLRHNGNNSSVMKNQGGEDINWKASFPGTYEVLIVDGESISAKVSTTLSGQKISWVILSVKSGQSQTIGIAN